MIKIEEQEKRELYRCIDHLASEIYKLKQMRKEVEQRLSYIERSKEVTKDSIHDFV